MLALVAIHALTRSQISRLLLADLDRAQGQLRVRRTGRLDHTVYLDEVTMKLATAWLVERNRRWPNTTNPHLIVTRRTAVDDAHPRASKEVTTSPFRTIGVPAGKLRQDRILDEARSTADPLGLMRIFGLANHSAVRYVAAARPAEIRPDPIAP
jgi:hypothetical protein